MEENFTFGMISSAYNHYSNMHDQLRKDIELKQKELIQCSAIMENLMESLITLHDASVEDENDVYEFNNFVNEVDEIYNSQIKSFSKGTKDVPASSNDDDDLNEIQKELEEKWNLKNYTSIESDTVTIVEQLPHKPELTTKIPSFPGIGEY